MIKNTHVLTALILSSLALPQWANASCSSILEKEYIKRSTDSAEFIGGLPYWTAAVTVPMLILSPSVGLLSIGITGVPAAFKEMKARDARAKYLIYQEAELGSGPHLEKIFEKIQRKFPESNLTMEELITAIRNADLKEAGCVAGKIPRKKDIIKIVLEDKTEEEHFSDFEEN